ncbi:MAG: TetR/AcrR family transcriptional regulator [Beutenbergiaceae bacterium]
MVSANHAPPDSSAARVPRGRLNRKSVVEAAFALADAQGVEALTMRSIAGHLGSKPMSLYRHVADKEDLLDALVERVYSEFDSPDPAGPHWRAQLRRRASSVRRVLLRHPWALTLIETRTGPDRPIALAHAEAVLATLVGAGASPRLAARAFVVLDAFIYGFALQQITMAVTDPAAVDTDSSDMPAQYPTMAQVAGSVASSPDYDFGAEFDPGLEVVLDGIERWIGQQ